MDPWDTDQPTSFCYVCNQEAAGTCSRCQKPFCEEHGGGRLWKPRNQFTLFATIRPVCDRCTPNQLWLMVQPFLLFMAFLVAMIFLVYWLNK